MYVKEGKITIESVNAQKGIYFIQQGKDNAKSFLDGRQQRSLCVQFIKTKLFPLISKEREPFLVRVLGVYLCRQYDLYLNKDIILNV